MNGWTLLAGLFLGVLLWWIGRWAWDAYRLRRRVLMEDALKVLMDCCERGTACTPETLAARLGLSLTQAMRVVRHLAAQGLAVVRGNRLELTPEGRALALHILRAHRLWERYLRDYTDLSLERIHALADRMEHRLSPQDVRRLSATLGHPQHDPHGDPIPHGEETPQAPGTPLNEWPPGKPARIVHVEDEPLSVFEQILAEGLLPGSTVEVLETTPQGVHLRLLDEARELWLAPIVAGNIHVVEAPSRAEPAPEPRWTLAEVPLGQKVRVVALSPRLRGLLRRRLLDLGFTPGAEVVPVMESAFGRGDPRAYRIRGTTIALRREQAAAIWVEPADSQRPTAASGQQSAVDRQQTADSGT